MTPGPRTEEPSLHQTCLPPGYEDFEPKHEENNTYTGDIMCSIIDPAELTYKIYSDQNGRFPVKSSRGNQCIFILRHFDTNTIHYIPLKNRYASRITQA